MDLRALELATRAGAVHNWVRWLHDGGLATAKFTRCGTRHFIMSTSARVPDASTTSTSTTPLRAPSLHQTMRLGTTTSYPARGNDKTKEILPPPQVQPQ